MKRTILVVDDDGVMRLSLAEALRAWGYAPVEAAGVAACVEVFEGERPAAVLLDIDLPDGSGLDALLEIKRRQADAVVIMVTGGALVENAIAALRGGAYDFITKPVNLEELRVAVRNGLEAYALRHEVGELRRERAREFSFDCVVGESPAFKRMLDMARKIAASEASTVLLQGESGTGKDLVAKAIHYASRRRDSPFVAINCAALPANLVESELFGYEKGAFTDAKNRKEGLFEQAEGGTLFLDEIGELELGAQAKLLRVFEEAAFRRVGGLRDIPLDVRVIAASNRNLRAEAAAGRFRLDLYYRLSVIEINVPPLRERGSDALLLAEHYINSFNERLRLRGKIKGLSPEAGEALKRYGFPGNVRELKNIIERAVILEDAEMITTEHLPHEVLAGVAEAAASEDHRIAGDLLRLPAGGVALDAVEDELVRQAMERTGGNQTRAAELLRISRDQLRYRLKKTGGENSRAET